MNTRNLAINLAGVGLAAVISYNTGKANSSILAKWRDRTVMAISGTAGTTLSLLQCIREGPNVSKKTMITLATNACVFAFSCAQSWADFTTESFGDNVINRCISELLSYGEMRSSNCQSLLDDEAFEWEVEEKDTDSYSYHRTRVTWYRFEE